MALAPIRSDGDLEVLVLHEAHSALAALIGPNLYTMGGAPPEQEIRFHNESSFDLFLILLVELFAQGNQAALIDEKSRNWSLMDALGWICLKYPEEAKVAGLDVAHSNLTLWINERLSVDFWCADIGQQIKLTMSVYESISFGANTAKHHMLRLSVLFEKLESLCKREEYEYSPQELIVVLKAMVLEIHDILIYQSSYLVGLLGAVFLALNSVIKNRYNKNPTNRFDQTIFPKDITSDVIKGMYLDVLVFQNYGEQRIRDFTPITRRRLQF